MFSCVALQTLDLPAPWESNRWHAATFQLPPRCGVYFAADALPAYSGHRMRIEMPPRCLDPRGPLRLYPGRSVEVCVKAIVIREFGPPGVLRYEEVQTPEPGPAEMLIKVHAVSVNRTLDTVVRAGKYARRVTLPLIPGVDPSGIVDKVGPGVTARKVGDRVTVQLRSGPESGADTIRALGAHAWGGYAQYVRALAERTSIVPDDLDFATATVISRHHPTAFHLLRDRAKLKSGEWVLVIRATSSKRARRPVRSFIPTAHRGGALASSSISSGDFLQSR